MNIRWMTCLAALCVSASLAAEPTQGTGQLQGSSPGNGVSQSYGVQTGTQYTGEDLLQRVSSDMDKLIEGGAATTSEAINYPNPANVELVVSIR